MSNVLLQLTHAQLVGCLGIQGNNIEANYPINCLFLLRACGSYEKTMFTNNNSTNVGKKVGWVYGQIAKGEMVIRSEHVAVQ